MSGETESGTPFASIYGPEALAERFRTLLAGRDTAVLLAGGTPHGLAVLRFRPAIFTEALECYLAELYVAPDRRGRGLGRALLEAAMELARQQGADHMDLGTSEDDVAARAGECAWLTFDADTEWFHAVVWDLGIAALRPDGRTVAVLAGTDTD